MAQNHDGEHSVTDEQENGHLEESNVDVTQIPRQFLTDIVKRIKELSGEVAVLRLMVDPTKKFPSCYPEPENVLDTRLMHLRQPLQGTVRPNNISGKGTQFEKGGKGYGHGHGENAVGSSSSQLGYNYNQKGCCDCCKGDVPYKGSYSYFGKGW